MNCGKRHYVLRLDLQLNERRRSARMGTELEVEELLNRRARLVDLATFIWQNSRRWTRLRDMPLRSGLSRAV
jgi:hypothetical protein